MQISRLVQITNHQVVGPWILLEPADAASGVLNAVAVPSSLEVAPVPLREGPHVHHEDVYFEVGFVLLGHHGLFGGVHAAHGGAVVVTLVA